MEVREKRVEVLIRPFQRADFSAAIKRTERFEADFKLSEHEVSYPPQGVGPVTGKVKVECPKTGRERVYEAGNGTSWFHEFEKDLTAGNFD